MVAAEAQRLLGGPAGSGSNRVLGESPAKEVEGGLVLPTYDDRGGAFRPGHQTPLPRAEEA